MTINRALNDPVVVAREYATDERFRGRSLYEAAIYEGPDPREHALLALHEARPRRLLEVGCGTGEFAERAARVLGVSVVGLDQSARMVELTRERGVDAIVGDAQNLPFDDGVFDGASALWMLYHLADLDAGLAEMARVLRPGGRLVAVTNSERHVEEIWGVEPEFPFTAENGAAELARNFARVERRDVHGAATFATRENLVAYLAAFETLHGRDETSRADELPIPLRVSCFNCVFVADKGA